MKRTSFPYFLLFLLAAFSANLAAQTSAALTAKLADRGAAAASGLVRPRTVAADSAPGESATPAAVPVASLERQAFELLNAKRRENGLAPLAWNEDVARVARMHSQNMANFRFFSHRGVDGSMVDDRADHLGVSKWRAIGENIAYLRGYRNPVEFAVERWMESEGHRQNLLNAGWQESGVGVAVTEDGTYYFTQVFLLRK